jgi:hypothetical protein
LGAAASNGFLIAPQIPSPLSSWIPANENHFIAASERFFECGIRNRRKTAAIPSRANQEQRIERTAL